MEKFLTKENILIVCVVFWAIVQSNYFATKLELSELKNEVLQQKIELQQYSDKKDAELLQQIEVKYDKIMQKLDKLK